jgi:hypothetical protein
MGNITECNCKCRDKKNEDEVNLPSSQKIEIEPIPEEENSSISKENTNKKDLNTLFKSSTASSRKIINQENDNNHNISKNNNNNESNFHKKKQKNKIETKVDDNNTFKRTTSKVKVSIKDNNIKKKIKNHIPKNKKNEIISSKKNNVKKKHYQRPKTSEVTRFNSKLNDELINETLLTNRKKNRMILKSNHSKSQFKSFSHYLEEKYENDSKNKHKYDNSEEENENSFLSNYFNIFNSSSCKNFLNSHHLFLRNLTTEFKIYNLINVKLLNSSNDEILFQSEMDKILFSGEKIISKKYIERYWTCHKIELRIYTSKQKFINSQIPIHVYKFNKMKRACLVDFDSNRKSNTFETPAFKKKNDPCNFLIYFKNESFEVFGSENEELIEKWVTIINYFIENST